MRSIDRAQTGALEDLWVRASCRAMNGGGVWLREALGRTGKSCQRPLIRTHLKEILIRLEKSTMSHSNWKILQIQVKNYMHSYYRYKTLKYTVSDYRKVN